MLQGTVQNFAIDLAGALFFGFLVARDLKAKAKAEAVVEREDALGRLQVCPTNNERATAHLVLTTSQPLSALASGLRARPAASVAQTNQLQPDTWS